MSPLSASAVPALPGLAPGGLSAPAGRPNAQIGTSSRAELLRHLVELPHLEARLHRLPAGADPFSYRGAQVERSLQSLSVLPSFSIPLPGSSNSPILSNGRLVGVDVAENLHSYALASSQSGGGFEAANQAEEQRSGEVRVSWRPIPQDYLASPDRQPPPTPFDPSRPQRFELRDGHFSFFGAGKAGFTGFGTGITSPNVYGDQPIAPAGAIVEVLEGFGQLEGLRGLVMINGKIEPPATMHLSILPAFLDFQNRLQTTAEVDAVLPMPDPDPTSSYLMLCTGTGPEHLLGDTRLLANGMVSVRSRQVAPMRGGDLSFSIQDHKLVSRRQLGRVIGTGRRDWFFGPLQGRVPVSSQIRNGCLTILDESGEAVGRIHTSSIEGRMFPVEIPFASARGWYGGGFGPITEADGIFAGATGQVSSLELLSVFPLVQISIQLIRLNDSDGLYRRAVQRAWRQG